ncbi:S41 family peptidase [Demequina aurantiaca]|uniref:S41 family peptidase n=1 Tax=Demequina aurantiaca TaxID=676200 RepID=UPI003D32C7DD
MTRRAILRRSGAAGLMLLVLMLSGCSRSSDGGVREYVDEAVAGLGEGYYADSDAWDKALEEELPGLYAEQTIPDTYGALRRLTEVAGGHHSSFSTPAEIAEWNELYSPGGVPLPTVTYGGVVANLSLPAFSSEDQDEIDEYLGAAARIFDSERASEACGWVVDLSLNGGGNLWTMLTAVSPLLDDGVVEAFRDREGSTSNVTVTGNTVTWDAPEWDSLQQEWGTFPGDVAKFEGRPIAILQSSVTGSAAESVIVAFAGQERVKTFGLATAGFTTVNDGFELPDGAFVTLSFALMGDREGTFHEGPIAPDQETSGGIVGATELAESWLDDECRQ